MLFVFAMSSFAQAGTITSAPFTTLAGSLLGWAMIVGAIFVAIGIATSISHFLGHNVQQGAMYLAFSIIGGVVVGMAPQWVSSLTGVAITPKF